VAYKIWRSDGTPVIFSQPRVGKDLKTFKFYKFRSMVKNAEDMLKEWEATNSREWQEYTANNFKLANDPRLISIGAFIRRTSIDELPQLFNVLRGEMSLVGPRPLLPREQTDYGDDLSLYAQTPPGLTGLWQISGRSQTTFEDRVIFDTWYVKNWSIWTDITILFKTWSVVFKRRGAY
jgi:undecaprenyl-phosphate galactose phosphotransferase